MSTPAEYAKGLRYGAERSDASAARMQADSKPWSPYEVAYFKRAARRLRAMAALCDRSTCSCAGGVDFRRLNDPTIPREVEDAVVLEIEAGR